MLRSIDWMTYRCQLTKNTPIELPIVDCVLGTLNIDNLGVVGLLFGLSTQSGKYPTEFYFKDSLSKLFEHWIELWNPSQTQPTLDTAEIRLLRLMGANNNHWNNRPTTTADLNFDISHPMFVVDEVRAYNWHIAPQPDNKGIGTLIMDSPRTIEIHAALDAGNYSIHSDPTKKKENNLGFLIENTARVNGIRFDENGEIDLKKEKDFYQPKTINNPTLGTPNANGKYNKYGMSCFGTIGMIIPHLPTTYGKDGKQQQLFDVIHDNQQLAMAILRQLDVSLSIQHGSEIRINGLDGKVHAYPNQLAVQLECLQRLEKIKYLTEKSFLINTVTGTEVRELFSGIGIPVTQKFLPLKDPDNSRKTLSLPYFGHQKNKPSIAGMLTTTHVNLAVINGVLMPKKQPEKNNVMNPFKTFAKPK
jgi:hypothetical protein